MVLLCFRNLIKTMTISLLYGVPCLNVSMSYMSNHEPKNYKPKTKNHKP